MEKSGKNNLKLWRRLIILFIGSSTLSFGIAMYLKADLGSDPLTTFLVGLSKIINISIGRATQMTMLITLIVIFFLDRKYIGLGTIINVFLTGELLNLFMRINLENYNSTTWRLIILAIGLLTYSIGLAIIIMAGLGQGAVDSIMSILKDKFNISVRKARTILDVALLVIGVILGGPIGIGTGIGALVNGPLMAGTLKFFNYDMK